MIFSEHYIKQLAKEHYHLEAEVKALNGYDELNFLLTGPDDRRYVFKVATDEHGYEFLGAQVKIIDHLSQSSVADKFQHFLLNTEGKELTPLLIDGRNYYLRILSYLEGTFWVDLPHHSDDLLLSLGQTLAVMDDSLKNFCHSAMHRHYEWDIANTPDAQVNLPHIKDHEKRRVAAYFFMQFREEVQPLQHRLRKAYIYNDANDYNVLADGVAVTGLIDFGDMVYTQLINNLAVACTYAMFRQADVLRAAALVVKGYHREYPLTEDEVSILYYLIAARLCISVTRSAFNASLKSDNDHHFVTEKHAWDLLFRLIGINPVRAHNAFRLACGFSSIIAKDDDYAALENKRKEHVGRNLSISYQGHLKIVKGALQYLYDDKGNTFIDCVNNVSHVGHCHPAVVKAIQKQTATLNTNTRYLHEHLAEYAAKLTATLPSKLQVCYFTNSGSEANDLAIRMSRHYTGQQDVIVLDHAYHGTSTAAIEMSPYKFDGKGGSAQKPYVHKAMNPDLYRGNYGYADADAGKKYAADVRRIITELSKENKAPAAFICETLLGVGGQIPLPPGYLKEVYRHVKASGGICVADEVQVGFGRVGEAFWGFELQGVEPDIVVLGKPIGNGHPLAAVIVSEEIAAAFDNGMEYFNTYGGNPVSMAAGLAVLQVIEDEELQKNALETGDHLMNGLKGLMKKHSLIGDVRGHGLFIGVELVTDRASKVPAVPAIDAIVEQMKERGFLLSTDGPFHNVLKIKPPIIFSKKNADEMVSNLNEVMYLAKVT